MKRLLGLLLAAIAALMLGPVLAQTATSIPADSSLAFSPASPPVVPDDLLAKIRRRGVLIAGVSNFVPWAMHDKSGRLVGYEVDVVNQLASDLGVKAEFVPVSHEYAIADLIAGRFDVVLNRMSITPQRALVVDFSHPLVVSSVELLVNAKLAGQRKILAEFDSPEVTVGVHKGTATEDVAMRRLPRARFVEFEDDVERFEALRAGKITAAVALTPIPGVVAARYPDIVAPLAEPLAKRAQAFAVRPGDKDFLNYLNAWITFQTLEGWLPARVDYWFKDLGWTASM
jgi:polar amino acid transport system substrate-binding protein